MLKKTLISSLIYFGLMVLILQSCGPNAEQTAKQKAQDSLHRRDSLAIVQKKDSIAKVAEMEKMKQDSIKAIAEKEQKGEIIWADDKHGYFVDTRNQKKYKVIKIGNQTWMAENLAFKANKGCWAYDNKESNAAKYGYLYNWETAKKVCPTGWHLPSENEVTVLIDYLGGKEKAHNKIITKYEWSSDEANNSSGFTALPGGSKGYEGNKFYMLGKESVLWLNKSRESYGGGLVGYYIKIQAGGYVPIEINSNSIDCGFSVRYIKTN